MFVSRYEASLLLYGSKWCFVLTCRSEYDHGVNTYSPEGRLFQVEYAMESIKVYRFRDTLLLSTIARFHCSWHQNEQRHRFGCWEAIDLQADRSQKVCFEGTRQLFSVEKIMEIDHHIGCAMSGLVADATTLIDQARGLVTNYHFTYNGDMKVRLFPRTSIFSRSTLFLKLLPIWCSPSVIITTMTWRCPDPSALPWSLVVIPLRRDMNCRFY